jgi:hypothetical protein
MSKDGKLFPKETDLKETERRENNGEVCEKKAGKK